MCSISATATAQHRNSLHRFSTRKPNIDTPKRSTSFPSQHCIFHSHPLALPLQLQTRSVATIAVNAFGNTYMHYMCSAGR